MKERRRFSEDVLRVLRESKGLRIRAGQGSHRFIGIWFVLVRDRVFVRSWSVKLDGWYKTFLKEPYLRNVAQSLAQAAGTKAPLDHNTRLLIEATVDELITVAPRAGFSIHDLNKLLDSGMELDEVVDCIAAAALKRAA